MVRQEGDGGHERATWVAVNFHNYEHELLLKSLGLELEAPD